MSGRNGIPAWYQEVVRKWQAGIAHVFVLYGNTPDTVDGVRTLEQFLVSSGLCAPRPCVMVYDRARGLRFPLPSHREAFYRALGLSAPSPEEEVLPAEPAAALRLAGQVLARSAEDGGPYAALVVLYAETIVPSGDLQAMGPEDRTVLTLVRAWASDPEFVRVGPPVFLVAEELAAVHPSLRAASSRVELVEVPYPALEERLAYVEALSERHGVVVEDTAELARVTAGLKRVHIEDIFLRASLEGVKVDASLASARKQEIVRGEFQEVLELPDPPFGLDAIGGYEHVKQFFRCRVVEPLKKGDLRRVPMGVLLLGPPGTGKTAFAMAVARESGLNCAVLNVSRLFDRWVGSSEARLERALSCIESLAPCLVILDEIDQAGMGRESQGDSGVSNRLFRRLLEYMSDARRRGRVVFVGITNRPDLLDPALKRPGRFDVKLPVLPPGPEERVEVFRAVCRRYGIPAEVKDFSSFVRETEGWTGAEIEALVLKAWEVAGDSGSAVLKDEHLAEALDLYIPSTCCVEEMTRLALREVSDLSLVPPEYRHLVKERKKKEAQVVLEAPARSVRKL
ncbi:AAA ATPase central domain protein [Ammonifex degensii KC4]|uniref:AAA ATPase central domain protein n=1 Tax=Ammonifex degensii (strain DSM 10501 / KC4) TaxID=429009 RepID=C9RC51_AMMDK|nr:ATP-binding protein [Ammonifex degensii]ACX51828.1 AAA ATPase central domain protein [Ammonifex degensii KC4]